MEKVEKKDKKTTLCNKQEKKVLHKGKIIKKRLKYDLLETLKDIPKVQL